MSFIPNYERALEPRHPCREMPTRHCPVIYEGICGEERPCARYESEEAEPWLPEVIESAKRHGIDEATVLARLGRNT